MNRLVRTEAGAPGARGLEFGRFAEQLVVELRRDPVGALEFADDGRRANHHSSARLLAACHHILHPFLEFFRSGASLRIILAMPNVVDADIDDDERRLAAQHVLFQSALQIRHLIAADAGIEGLDAEVFVFFQ